MKKNSFRICLTIVFSVCLSNFSWSKDFQKSGEVQITFGNLTVLQTEYAPGSYVSPGLSESGFKPYDGSRFDFSMKFKKRMITLREEFVLDESLSKVPLALLFGPADTAYAVYLNGLKLFWRGQAEDLFRSEQFDTINEEIPESFLYFGSRTNTIVFEIYPTYENAPFASPVLTTETRAAQMAFSRNLFNVHLVQAACVLSLFIGLYFLFRFGSRKFRDFQYLYFAMLGIFFGLSYFNIFFNNDASNEIFNEKITRSSFAIASMFITLFVREYTGITRKRIWTAIVVILVSSVTAIATWFQPDKEAIHNFFSTVTSNAVITPLLIYSIGMLVAGFIRSRRKEYIILLGSFVVIIICSLQDLRYYGAGVAPYCWLVPFAYLLLLVCIFAILAMEESVMLIESQTRAGEIKVKNESLQTVLDKIGTVSKNLLQSGNSLEEIFQKSLEVIEQSGKTSVSISKRMLEELSRIENLTRDIAERMETSGDKIPQAISNQTKAVEETSKNVENMHSGIIVITESADKTNAVVSELSDRAAESREIVLQSRKSIESISAQSEFIGVILRKIEEIVESNKVLSINAAIESARAGESGKGFGVVALEIRNLAVKSKESLTESQKRLMEMKAAIQKGLEQSEDVTKLLLEIIDKSGSSAEMVQGFSSMINRQKSESDAIQKNTRLLLRESISIRDMAEDEKRGNEAVKTTLNGLKSSLEDISTMLKSMTESSGAIYTAMENIGSVMTENKNNNAILEETIQYLNKSL